MDYQTSDLTLSLPSNTGNFNLKDFTDAYTDIQNYINGTRTKIGSMVTDIGNRVLTSTYNTKMSSLDSSITTLNNKTSKLSSDGTTYSGNADTATSLQTARTINIQDSDGINTGTGVSFDGTANKTIKLPAIIKANLTGTASGSLKIKTTQTSSNANFQIPFVDNVTSEQKILYTDNTNGHLSYNPSTNTLTATKFSGIATYASNIGNASENLSYSQLVSIISSLTFTGKIEFRTIDNSTYEVYSKTGIASSMTNTGSGNYVLSGYKLVGEPTIVQARPNNGSHILTITVTSNSPFTIQVTRTGQGWENNNHAYIEFMTVKI